MTPRLRMHCLAALMLVSCDREASDQVSANPKLLGMVVNQISTAPAWAVTGTTEVRLKQLDEWAAWDIDGTIQMLDAANGLIAQGQADRVEQVVRARVAELEDVTPELIGAKIGEYQERLGGGVCAITAATKEDGARAKERLSSARTPSGLDADLTRRVEALRARARRVGGFHRAHCERGQEYVLFGWIDKQAVPLFDLLEPMKAPAP